MVPTPMPEFAPDPLPAFPETLMRRALAAESAWLQGLPTKAAAEPWLLVRPETPFALPSAAGCELHIGADGQVRGTVRALCRELPFAADHWRRITVLHALEWPQLCTGLLSECARTLRPGGELFVVGFKPLHPRLWRHRLGRSGLRAAAWKPQHSGRLALLARRLGMVRMACSAMQDSGQLVSQRSLAALWPALYVLHLKKGGAATPLVARRPAFRVLQPGRTWAVTPTPRATHGMPGRTRAAPACR